MNMLTALAEREMTPASRRRFFAIVGLVFIASVLTTYALHASMSSMHGIPMPGGAMLPTSFTPMCGRSWLRAAASFVGMWIAMMTAMMLPSFAPLLWRHRIMLERAGVRRVTLHSVLMAAGYVGVWTLIGVAVCALGAGFSEIAMRMPAIARCVPFAGGTVVLLAGVLQFSKWHAHLQACCRDVAPARASAFGAWLDGVRRGFHCVGCCAGLTATLLVFGMMDLRAMAFVTLAISIERLAPFGEAVARVIGAALLVIGSAMILFALSNR